MYIHTCIDTTVDVEVLGRFIFLELHFIGPDPSPRYFVIRAIPSLVRAVRRGQQIEDCARGGGSELVEVASAGGEEDRGRVGGAGYFIDSGDGIPRGTKARGIG